MKKLTTYALLGTLFLESTLAFGQAPKVVEPPKTSPTTEGSASKVEPSTENAPAPKVVTPSAEASSESPGYAQYAQTTPVEPKTVEPRPLTRDELRAVPGSNPKYNDITLGGLEIRRENEGFGMPITLLAVGSGVTLLASAILLSGVGGKTGCNNSSYVSSSCNTAADSLLVLGGLGLAVGIPLIVFGGISLGSRIGERRELSDEIELREKYHHMTSFRLDLAPIPTPGGGFSGGFVGSF